MKTIFEQREFHSFAKDNLTESRATIYEYSQYQPTVFISHKHDDLEPVDTILAT